MAATVAPQRPMDRVLAALAVSDARTALRIAVPLLEGDPSALALFSVARAALALSPTPDLRQALALAVDAAVEAGNLPLAVAAASSLRAAGVDAGSSWSAIAGAFGRGSPRLRDRRGSPPELPKPPPDVAPLPEKIGDRELVERAVAATQAFSAGFQRHGEAPLVPAPLFSSLEPDALRAFIEIFDVRVVAEGERVVSEGELGSEAFVIARGELDVEKRTTDALGRLHLARLGNGALVGEMALLSRAPRAATVLAARPSLLLVADKVSLDRVAQKSPRVAREFAEHCRRRMLDNLARTCVLFRNVSSAERSALVERFAIKAFEPGDRIIHQGRTSEGLYIVASGDAAVVRQDGDERTVVAHLSAGDVLGEVALVLRRPAIAEVVAHHPTITLFLPRERFLDLVRAHPKMFVDLYELAVSRDEETSSLDLSETLEMDDSVLV